MKKIERNTGDSSARTERQASFIPAVDLREQYKGIKKEVDEAIAQVFESSSFILGENVRRFEAEFAEYCGARFGIGVASGMDALQLALRACDIKRGDEVIATANSAFAALAISLVGARPVFVDIDETYTIDVGRIKEKMNSHTRAILPVHLFGQPADMAPLTSLARENSLYVIEDACQAHGAEYRGQKAGSIGTFGCFSFYPTKNLGGYGDGGMVLTSDEKLAEKVSHFRNYGQSDRFRYDAIADSSRLDEIQAAILRVKLRKLEQWNDRRRENAALYSSLLRNVKLPVERAEDRNIYHQYVIRLPRRDDLRDFLTRNNVQTDIHYPVPIHRCKAYAHLRLQEGNLPVTEEFAREILSLPVYPELGKDKIEAIVSLVNRFLENS